MSSFESCASIGKAATPIETVARIGSLEVYANDAALGMGLADRARSKCKGADQCAFWVEGYWRGKAEDSYQFDVTKVGEPIAVTELAAASFVEVEGESGN